MHIDAHLHINSLIYLTPNVRIWDVEGVKHVSTTIKPNPGIFNLFLMFFFINCSGKWSG